MRILNYIIIGLLFLTTKSFAIDNDKIAVEEFKSYLTSLKSVAIDFVQYDTRGSEAHGRLIIVKPRNFLCNYYEPYPLMIAGNKSYVSVYDFDLEQLTRIESKENMFNFLLTDQIDLDKHFNIISAKKNASELYVELYHKDSERNTKIIISLSPKKLKSIVTNEADGNVITLNISHITNITNVSNDLFVLKNPEIYGPTSRMDHLALEKKYLIAH